MPKERECSPALSLSECRGDFLMSPDAVLWLFSTLASCPLLDLFCYCGALEGQCEYDLLEADPFSLSTLLLLEQMDGVS